MAKASKTKELFLKKLQQPPSAAIFDTHRWADFIEIKCLFNVDGVYSKDDFLDSIRTYKDLLPKNYRGGDDVRDDASDEDEDEEEDDDDRSLDVAKRNDNEEQHATSSFSLLKTRVSIFNDYYPFSISSDRRLITKRKTLTWKHRCYIFLLFCSALRYFAKYQSVFTTCFEVFSLHVLKALIPGTAEAHLFGSGNSMIRSRWYTGHIWEKICKLKNDLNEPVIKVKKSAFPKNDSGDTGIDFVAWVPNGDNQSHIITFTGQAACTNNWYSKKYSSSSSALAALIPVSVAPINIVFIPFSVRMQNGDWHKSGDIGNCVLMDRQRLIYHFNNNRNAYLKLPCDGKINEILKLKDSVQN